MQRTNSLFRMLMLKMERFCASCSEISEASFPHSWQLALMRKRVHRNLVIAEFG
jgi:hypothetical protein